MISWFRRAPRTVDSIVADISRQAAELRQLATQKEEEEIQLEEQIKLLYVEKDDVRIEMSRASAVALKLESLVS